MKKAFHLPGAVVWYDQQWPEHGGWLGILGSEWQIQSVRYKPQMATGQFRFSFVANAELFAIELPITGPGSACDFLDWLKKAPIKLMSPIEYTFSVPEAPKASCPVCYGTGFHKGFGAPCSKGCKAP